MADLKYFKPKSLTWWAATVPVAIGGMVAGEPLHGWVELTQTLRSMTGDVPPAMLINAGLAGIGLRGAVK